LALKKVKNGWGKIKKSYDNTWKFQIEWATRLPWVEGFVLDGLFIRNVRCKVCSSVENNEKFIGCKWYTLTKH
jgi:hypothetical protein